MKLPVNKVTLPTLLKPQNIASTWQCTKGEIRVSPVYPCSHNTLNSYASNVTLSVNSIPIVHENLLNLFLFLFFTVGDEVVVMYMDYGNQEVVPFATTHILPLPQTFAILPAQALSCTLYGKSSSCCFSFTNPFIDLFYHWLMTVLYATEVEVHVRSSDGQNEVCADIFVSSEVLLGKESVDSLKQVPLDIKDIVKAEGPVNLFTLLSSLTSAISPVDDDYEVNVSVQKDSFCLTRDERPLSSASKDALSEHDQNQVAIEGTVPVSSDIVSLVQDETDSLTTSSLKPSAENYLPLFSENSFSMSRNERGNAAMPVQEEETLAGEQKEHLIDSSEVQLLSSDVSKVPSCVLGNGEIESNKCRNYHSKSMESLSTSSTDIEVQHSSPIGKSRLIEVRKLLITDINKISSPEKDDGGIMIRLRNDDIGSSDSITSNRAVESSSNDSLIIISSDDSESKLELEMPSVFEDNQPCSENLPQAKDQFKQPTSSTEVRNICSDECNLARQCASEHDDENPSRVVSDATVFDVTSDVSSDFSLTMREYEKDLPSLTAASSSKEEKECTLINHEFEQDGSTEVSLPASDDVCTQSVSSSAGSSLNQMSESASLVPIYHELSEQYGLPNLSPPYAIVPMNMLSQTIPVQLHVPPMYLPAVPFVTDCNVYPSFRQFNSSGLGSPFGERMGFPPLARGTGGLVHPIVNMNSTVVVATSNYDRNKHEFEGEQLDKEMLKAQEIEDKSVLLSQNCNTQLGHAVSSSKNGNELSEKGEPHSELVANSESHDELQFKDSHVCFNGQGESSLQTLKGSDSTQSNDDFDRGDICNFSQDETNLPVISNLLKDDGHRGRHDATAMDKLETEEVYQNGVVSQQINDAKDCNVYDDATLDVPRSQIGTVSEQYDDIADTENIVYNLVHKSQHDVATQDTFANEKVHQSRMVSQVSNSTEDLAVLGNIICNLKHESQHDVTMDVLAKEVQDTAVSQQYDNAECSADLENICLHDRDVHDGAAQNTTADQNGTDSEECDVSVDIENIVLDPLHIRRCDGTTQSMLANQEVNKRETVSQQNDSADEIVCNYHVLETQHLTTQDILANKEVQNGTVSQQYDNADDSPSSENNILCYLECGGQCDATLHVLANDVHETGASSIEGNDAEDSTNSEESICDHQSKLNLNLSTESFGPNDGREQENRSSDIIKGYCSEGCLSFSDENDSSKHSIEMLSEEECCHNEESVLSLKPDTLDGDDFNKSDTSEQQFDDADEEARLVDHLLNLCPPDDCEYEDDAVIEDSNNLLFVPPPLDFSEGSFVTGSKHVTQLGCKSDELEG